ncbi:MAG TPA: L-2-hydroxyglutarate oxidase [Gemmatimonadaceae bacterium]|jgi:L-2-hydroxyglutarate oxidase|nr:L-2-hydroxyglutarate oxidase [Gemmatimonadaceae bacterium]
MTNLPSSARRTEAARDNDATVIVGGGIIGLATAYKLLEADRGRRVIVLEKESAVARHQSGHNSGVLHAGLYYAPGSLKARLAVDGIRQMKAFCREFGVPHEACGKLVVATSEQEVPRLDELLRRGTANGLAGLRIVSPAEALEREPHVRCAAAVLVPEEGIVDYRAVCHALVDRIVERGGEVRTSTAVETITPDGRGWVVATPHGDLRASYLINCAGLQCDRVARLAGEKLDLRIVPFRGTYFKLRPERRSLVNQLVYPVPDPAFPFLGVHFTRMIGGDIEAGPNAVLALAREGYRPLNVNLRDAASALLFPGLWRFLRRYPSMVGYELRRAFSRRLFCASLQRLIPEIQAGDLLPGGAGVRAQAVASDGTLVNDFVIRQSPRALHLLNAPSPGATASLAIGDVLVSRMAEDLSS